MGAPVVFDVNVLVNALKDSPDPYDWPVLPPRTGKPQADAVGVVNDAREFSLWLSPHILRNTRRVLIEAGLAPPDAEAYLDVLEEIAVGSGGQVVEPERTVHASRDHEDNLILDLAAHAGAVMVVSDDTDLTSLSPWRGTPILRSRDFSARVDAARRATVTSPPLSATDRLREQAARRHMRSGANVDTVLTQNGPDEYRQLRQTFADHQARLAEIVDAWNHHNPTMIPRIEVWRTNLERFTERTEQIDEIAKTQPSVAHDALATLNEKITFALDHLDPARAGQRRPPPPTIGFDAAEKQGAQHDSPEL